MNRIDISEVRVAGAIAAITTGNISELTSLIAEYPHLVRSRLVNKAEGYFKDPYLLWFIADNPVRSGKLPRNIIKITQELLQAVKREAPEIYQFQLDYALGLVATGNTPHECGVQIAMIDLLLVAGASPAHSMAALANGNPEAARHLVDRGDKLTLAAAVCLGYQPEIDRLAASAGINERTTAMAAAAYYGKADMIKKLLDLHIDPNGFPDAGSGFHSHATALHHAVSSGSLACVELLTEAGADTSVPDRIYNGTPLGWADYLQRDADNKGRKSVFSKIENYLRSRS